jgi:parallel beta-helix repeat protein
MTRVTAIMMVIVFATSFPVLATVINVPADFTTIQMAIDSSSNGDTVLAQPNTYYENINFHGHNIVLGSLFLTTDDTSYISATTLDASSSGRVIIINSGEDSTAKVIGFTIQNGSTGGDGGGIYCNGTEPVIANNIIRNNGANYYAGGILCWLGDVTIRDNIIDGNNGGTRGGGISIYSCSPEITGNLIINNHAGQCGGGIYGYSSNSDIINNTVVGNSSGIGGGLATSYSSFNIVNTIFWDNNNTQIGIFDGGPPTVSYSDIQGGYAGTGNIDCDPVFCDAAGGDYTLDRSSCCIGAGQSGVDMGAYGEGCATIPITILIPYNYSTIQAGIDASIDGDTVLVNPGTYYENIVYGGKGIILASLFLTSGNPSYIDSTIIDGDSSGSVVTFTYSEDSMSVLTGFTIRDGYTTDFRQGGGIHCDSASNPRIEYNTITENSSVQGGAGIYCWNSSPTISHNIIRDNVTQNYGGGGIYCRENSSPLISFNLIIENTSNADGGGILCALSSNPTVLNNTFSNNGAFAGGGMLIINPSLPILTNNIFWGDSAVSSPEIFVSSGSPSITYCDVQGGYAGEGNIDCDPMFCEPDSGDYQIAGVSCCLESGEGGVHMGAYGSGCGPYPVPAVTSVAPSQNELNVTPSSNISVTFDMEMDSSSINNNTIVVYGISSGIHQGDVVYDSASYTATVDLYDDFKYGEIVTVSIGKGIQSSIGIMLDQGFSWRFIVDVLDSPGTFAPDSLFPAGDVPHNSFAADLDGDGDLDLTAVNEASNNVAVLLNGGTGLYVLDSLYATGGSASYRSFTIDLDMDGDLDIVTANKFTNNMSTILNNGSAIFSPPVITAVGVYPHSIQSADIDGDCDPDVVVADRNGNSITVLLNDGSGNLTIDSTYPGNTGIFTLFLTDLENDGDFDIAAANTSGDYISVLFNNGQGKFSAPATYGAGDGPISLSACDIDNDGDNDLAVVNSNSSNISIFKNDGAGNLVLDSSYYTGGYPWNLFFGDVDGDGDQDIASANKMSYNLSILLNDGTGVFSVDNIYPTGRGLTGVFAADLDDDGDLDLATDNSYDDNISVMLNQVLPIALEWEPDVNSINVPEDSNIAVSFNVSMEEPSINDTTLVSIGNISGVHYGTFAYQNQSQYAVMDPTEDFLPGETVLNILTIHARSYQLIELGRSYVWSFCTRTSPSDGTFGAREDYAAGDGPEATAVADIDNDGYLDLLVVNGSDDSLYVLLNDGTGDFTNSASHTIEGRPVDLYSIDLESDNDMDIVTVNYDSSSVSVLLNDGTGNLSLDSTYGTDLQPTSINGGDFDGDGDIDLVVTNSGSDNIKVFSNRGDGDLISGSSISVGSGPADIAVADFDADLDQDIVIVNNSSNNISVFFNNGLSGFSNRTDYSVGDEPGSITVFDIEGDADIDILVTNSFSNNVSVLKNDGSGVFVADSTYAAGDGPISIYGSDFDGDGDIDFALAQYYLNNIAIWSNSGSGVFAQDSSYDVGSFPVNVAAGDFDGDKTLDLVSTNFIGDNISVLLNSVAAGCEYVTGDVNGSGSYNGLDITYGVNFFKGGSNPMCAIGSCPIPPCDAFFYCGDVNGSCSYNGLDITYGVNYFKGGSNPIPCGDCPPAGTVLANQKNQSSFAPSGIPIKGDEQGTD